MGWELFVEQCEPNARDSLMFSDVIIRGSDDDWSSRTAAVVPRAAIWVERATAEHEKVCGLLRINRSPNRSFPQPACSTCFCREFLSWLSEHDCRLIRAQISPTQDGTESGALVFGFRHVFRSIQNSETAIDFDEYEQLLEPGQG